MLVSHETASSVVDESFAILVEDLIERTENGEQLDMDAIIQQHPQHAEQLRAVWPAIDAMFLLAQSGATPSPHAANAIDLATASVDEPSARFGDNEIVAEIGRGGMGIVYRARQISLDREVALKILPLATLTDDRQVKRFEHEARSAALLDHPGIVSIHEVGCERGVHYYTMHYINGPTLADVLYFLRTDARQENDGHCFAHGGTATRRLERAGTETAGTKRPRRTDAANAVQRKIEDDVSKQRSSSRQKYFRTVAEWGRQLATALHHAYQHGVVHRDIKPSNVILDESRQVWILDFGLARLENSSTLTTSENLIGTWRYMSPEQAAAGFVDHRTDIYSLGVTLYELLTLQPAIGGTDREALLRKIAQEVPLAPRKLDPTLPRDLTTIVDKAIEKDPRDRYATAQDMANDLQRFLEQRPIMAQPPSLRDRLSKWSRRHVAVLWTVMVTALVMGSLLAISAIDAHSAKFRETRAKRTAQVERAEAIRERNNARLSQYHAEIVSGQIDWQLGNIGGLKRKLIRYLPVGEEPDHRGWEWYYLLSLCHPEERTLFWSGRTPYVSWSPDGEHVASGGCIWSAESGEPIHRFYPSTSGRRDGAWSLDGQQFAWGVTASDSAVYVWDRTSDDVCALRGHESSVWCVAFSPDGQQLASGSPDGTVRIWDVASGSVVQTLPAGVVTDLAWSPNGELLAVAEQYHLKIWKLSTAEIVAERGSSYHKQKLCWHPTSRQLAVCHAKRWYVLDTTDWSVQHEQVHPQGTGRDIAWSPDGEKVAVAHGEIVTIWQPPAADPIATLVGHLRPLTSVDWSPDGQKLVTSDNEEEIKIWDLSATSQPPPISTGGRLASLSWAPDSRTLQSVSAEDGSRAQWDATRGIRLDVKPRVVRDEMLLGPDHRLAAVRSDDDLAVKIVDAETNTVRAIWQASPSHVASRCFWSPDSSRLAIATTCDDQACLEFWDVTRERRISRWTKPRDSDGDSVKQVSWAHDGTRVAAVTAGERGEVDIVEVASGQQILTHVLGGFYHDGATSALSWSRGGDTLALGSSQGLIETIDVRSGKPVMSQKLHNARVNALAFFPDGQRLATAAGDGTVKVIEPNGGEELLTFQLVEGMATQLAWSPDGKRLAAATQSGAIQVWDASRGYEFTADGSRRDELAWAYHRRVDPPAWRRFLELAPDTFGFRMSRGVACSRLGLFDEAVEEFGKAVRPPLRLSLDAAGSRAIALLGARRLDAYREACAELLREFADSEKAGAILQIAWQCSLVPAPDLISEEVLEVGTWDREVVNKGSVRERLTVGASLYRDGQYEVAREVLTDLSARLEQSIGPHRFADLAGTQYFLAMTHQRLGDSAQAREYLQQAADNAAQALRQPHDFLQRVRWIWEVELGTLDREARALIGARPRSS